jgi:hypothetical protein
MTVWNVENQASISRTVPETSAEREAIAMQLDLELRLRHLQEGVTHAGADAMP